MAPTKEEINAYLTSSGIQAQLEGAVNEAVEKKPDDSVSFLAGYFKKLSTRAAASGMQALSQDAECMMDHCAKLDIYSQPAAVRGTGIICTIGPKTKPPEVITELRQCGLMLLLLSL